jgi:hypothetical protein
MPVPSFLTRLITRHPDGRKFDIQQQVQGYQTIPQIVLADLAEFCGATAPIPNDPAAAQRRAGRLDVWLRIIGHRALRGDEVIALQRGEGIAPVRRVTNA